MKKLIALLLAMLMLACSFAACSQDEDELVGFDIDLARAVFEKLELDVEFTIITWSQKEANLESKAIDCIWNGMTITPGRLEEMEISLPYLKNEQVAIIRKADAAKYTDKASMADAYMTAEGGSAGEAFIVDKENANAMLIGKEYNAAASQVDALVALNAKTADVAIMDAVLANYYLTVDSKYADSLQIVDMKLSEEPEQYGIAARKGSGLIKMINWALVELTKDGTVAEIAEKYGLESELLITGTETVSTELTDAEKADYDYIKSQGKIIVGYTEFAPIAYRQAK